MGQQSSNPGGLRLATLFLPGSIILHLAVLALAVLRSTEPPAVAFSPAAEVQVELVPLQPPTPEPPVAETRVPERLARGALTAAALTTPILPATRPSPSRPQVPPREAVVTPSLPEPAVAPSVVAAPVETSAATDAVPAPEAAAPSTSYSPVHTGSPTVAAVPQSTQRFGVVDGVQNAGPSDETIARLLREWHRRVQRHLAARALADYPRRALRDRLQGTAQLSVVIGESGRVTGVSLAQSSGHLLLDHAAVASLKAVSKVPPPPAAVAWGTRAVRIPVRYRLQ